MKREASGNAALPLSTIIRRTIWVAMLPLVLLAIGMAYHEVRAIQRDMEAQAASVAENAVVSIDNFSKSQIDALTVLAHSPLLQDETRWGEFHVEAMGFYRSFGTHVVVTDGKRPEQLLLSTRVPVGTPLPVLKTDKFRQTGPVILETGKPAVGDLFMGVIQREPLVGIGVPVPGKPLVVGTTVRNDVFQQIVDKVSLPTDWSLVLADSVGDRIASKGPSAVVAPAKQNVANSTLSPWTLTVSIPGAAYWQPVGGAAIALFAAIVGVTLMGFLGGNLTGRRLGKSVSRIAEGVGPFDVQELSEAHQKIDEAHKALRESEEQFRVLTQNLISAVALVNERGEISIVNKAFLRLFDLADDADILNVNSRDWSQWQVFDEHGRLLEVDEHPVRKAALTRAAVRDMLVAVQCPGCTDRKWMLVSAEPILDTQGNLHRLICTYHDITERKRAEEMLRESEQRFRLALKNSPVLVAMQDSNLVYQWAYNTRTRRPEDVIGKTDADLFAPEDLPSILEAKSKVLHTGQVVRQEQWLTSNGQRVFLDTYLEPVRDSGGKILGIRIAAVNLTEQKRAEEALRQSREDLDRAQAVGQTGWWRLDTIDNVLTWSQETHRIFGVPEGTPMSYEFFLSIVHPEDRQYVDTQWQAALRGEPYDIEHRIIADGRVKWVREKAYLEFDNKGELLGGFGITQDITARKEAQTAVERMRVMLEEGQKIAHVGSWEYLADAQTTVWSDEQCRIYGIDPAAGSPPYDVMLAKHIHPDDASALHEAFSAALRNHAIYEQEHRIVRPDGSVRVLYERALPYFDENGKLVKYMGVSLDITERKGAEDTLRRLNESLESKIRVRTADLHAANQALEQRASQLRELAGELTAAEQRERKSLAKLLHDGLQQYLVAARMRQSALIEDLENHSAKKSAIEIEGILIESISVSRSLAMELCPPALDGGILSGLEWLSRFMASKQGLDVNLLLDTGSPVLPENVKVFLFESVRELLLNVVKHSKTLSAKVHLKEDNQRLRVTVSDAGVGLDVSALQRRGSGGGFGLFSIRERIGLVGGSIEIDSQPGMGARFTITVPLANPDSARPATPPTCSFIDSSIPLSDSKVRILLVDDHRVVREGLAQMLGAEEDFEIVGQAEDGNGAVELTQILRPQIVLMDVTMPNMDGITATRIITKRHPEVRIVGLSLYSAEERAEEMIKAGARLYVSKTAPAEDLKKAIRRCVC